jgi:hypothetical protein
MKNSIPMYISPILITIFTNLLSAIDIMRRAHSLIPFDFLPLQSPLGHHKENLRWEDEVLRRMTQAPFLSIP